MFFHDFLCSPQFFLQNLPISSWKILSGHALLLKISRQLERLAAVWTLEYRQELECLKWAKTYQSYERPDFVMWYLLGVRSSAWDWPGFFL